MERGHASLGTIDVWELRQVLEAMGQKPTEEELFQMISEVDENMSGSIDFAEFLKVIENQKDRAYPPSSSHRARLHFVGNRRGELR